MKTIPTHLFVALWLALSFTAFVCVHQDRTIARQQQVIRLLERGCR